jgi:hypothetical protein
MTRHVKTVRVECAYPNRVINAVVMNVVLSYLATVRCWRVIVEGLSLARCSCHQLDGAVTRDFK